MRETLALSFGGRRSAQSASDRKNSPGEWVGESTRRSRVRLRDCVVGSGGGFEGDPVAEGGELGDVVADASLGDDAVGVVIGAEVVEAGGGVGEQVPDDDQEGARDRDQGLELAAAFDDAPVAFTQEGGGLGGRGGGVAEHALEVGGGLAGAATAGDRPRLDGARAQFGPRHQVRGGGESGHVGPDFGEDDLCRGWADAGDLIEPFDRGEPDAVTKSIAASRSITSWWGAEAGLVVGVGSITDGRGF